MELEIVKLWEENKDSIRQWFETVDEITYENIVEHLITDVFIKDNKQVFSKEFTTINKGYYCGMLVFILSNNSTYADTINDFYVTYVDYGSCPYCDVLEYALGVKDKEERVRQLMLIALHLIQKLKPLYSLT